MFFILLEHEGTDAEASPEESGATPAQSPELEVPDSAKETATELEVTFDERTEEVSPTDEPKPDQTPEPVTEGIVKLVIFLRKSLM